MTNCGMGAVSRSLWVMKVISTCRSTAPMLTLYGTPGVKTRLDMTTGFSGASQPVSDTTNVAAGDGSKSSPVP
jgi:hypothetical protein